MEELEQLGLIRFAELSKYVSTDVRGLLRLKCTMLPWTWTGPCRHHNVSFCDFFSQNFAKFTILADITIMVFQRPPSTKIHCVTLGLNWALWPPQCQFLWFLTQIFAKYYLLAGITMMVFQRPSSTKIHYVTMGLNGPLLPPQCQFLSFSTQNFFKKIDKVHNLGLVWCFFFMFHTNVENIWIS